VHVANVARIRAEAAQCSKAELNALVAGAGLASRRVSGALAMSRKGVADMAKAAAVAASEALAANENDIDVKQEMELDDDDSGRTPERVEEVRAEIRRRLALVGDARESKSLDHGSAVVAGEALPGGVASGGGAPETPA
jgi:hypothetical protein